MMPRELTGGVPAARNPAMTARDEMILQREGQRSGRRAVRAGGMLMAAGMAGILGGCVNVSAPDKPIVIELNINIRQEVVYRLDAQAAKTIEENKDIF
ncbi:YnbE family lipoprotein [Novosphingobium beihaiensis]|uniref:YnbE family lipoprotein n=1 Tax=Novosphingobium beihaiensis TaxID=2930389 RepID=A0ABT0BK96_9SPHN|nr:YnbE family lipoprotein [Novosphingobium beihaiensis]MCJ2185251.1 YnbE family lipoprotein [Novosphingobium beihaiensis]